MSDGRINDARYFFQTQFLFDDLRIDTSDIVVASLGDVDGDGAGDLAIALSGFSEKGSNDTRQGAVFVLYGPEAGWPEVVDLSALTPDQGYRLADPGLEAEFQGLGQRLQAIGDFNGDGFDDFMVDARLRDPSNFDASQAFIVLGGARPNGEFADVKSSGAIVPVLPFDRRADFTQFRLTDIDPIGDLNGDGFADVFLSANTYNANVDDPDAVVQGTILYGSADPEPIDLNALSPDQGTVISGLTRQLNFFSANGDFAFAPGDLNGDGIDDLFLHEHRPLDQQFETDWAGAVIFGKLGGLDPDISLDSLTPDQGFYLGGQRIIERSLEGAGTVSHSFDNTFVGAAYYTATIPEELRGGRTDVHTVLGPLDTSPDPEPSSLVPNATSSRQYSGIHAAGDINNDGFADFILRTNHSDVETRAYVMFGSETGIARDLATLTPEQGVALGYFDDFVDVLAHGDLDGDGIDDLVLTYPNLEIGFAGAEVSDGDNHGLVYVLFGREDFGSFTEQDEGDRSKMRVFEGITASSSLGASAAILPDSDGDGADDLFLGGTSAWAGFNLLAPGSTGIIKGHAGLKGSDQGPDARDDVISLSGGRDGRLLFDLLADNGNGADSHGNGDWLRVIDIAAAQDQLAPWDPLVADLADPKLLPGGSIITPVSFNVNDAAHPGIFSVERPVGFHETVTETFWYRLADADGDIADAQVTLSVSNPFLDIETLDGPNGYLLGTTDFSNGSSTLMAARDFGFAGDIDGDGNQDLFLSNALTRHDNLSSAGEVRIQFGTGATLPSLGPVDVGFSVPAIENGAASAPVEDTLLIRGSVLFQNVGIDSYALGDIDGDGKGDIAVRSVNGRHEDRAENFYSGAVYFVYGGGPGEVILPETATDANGVRQFFMSDSGTFRDASFAMLGDVNGDGFGDFGFGAPSASVDRNTPDQVSNAGSLFIVYGTGERELGSFDLDALTPAQGMRLDGTAQSQQLGRSLAAAGDFNGDGFADYLVGDGQQNSWLVFGGAAAPASRAFDAVTSQPGAAMGFSIDVDVFTDVDGVIRSPIIHEGLGDVNGDGLDDILMSANGTGEVYVVFGTETPAGNVVLNQLDGTNGFRITQQVGGNQRVAFGDFGAQAKAAGDLNDDGFADIVVSAPEAFGFDGATYVVYGSADPFPAVYEIAQMTPETGFGVLGRNRFGNLLDGGADLNGDGADDLLIYDAGRLAIVHGFTVPDDGGGVGGGGTGGGGGTSNRAVFAQDDVIELDLRTATSAMVDVTANDIDPDGDPVAVDRVAFDAALVGQSIDLDIGGTLMVEADGQVTYSSGPFQRFLGDGEILEARYDIDVTDGQGGDARSELLVRVIGANDAPDVDGILSFRVAESDDPFTVNLLAGATDPDPGDVLSVQNLEILEGDDFGLRLDGNQLQVTPTNYLYLNGDAVELVRVGYDVTDAAGLSTRQEVRLEIAGEWGLPVFTLPVRRTIPEPEPGEDVPIPPPPSIPQPQPGPSGKIPPEVAFLVVDGRGRIEEDSNGALIFDFKLDRPLQDDTVVSYTVAGATRAAADDADVLGGLPRDGVITIPAGETLVSHAVDVLADTVAELDEVVELTITQAETTGEASRVALGYVQAYGVIGNDDVVEVSVEAERALVYEGDPTDPDGTPRLDADGNPLQSEAVFVFKRSGDLSKELRVTYDIDVALGDPREVFTYGAFVPGTGGAGVAASGQTTTVHTDDKTWVNDARVFEQWNAAPPTYNYGWTNTIQMAEQSIGNLASANGIDLEFEDLLFEPLVDIKTPKVGENPVLLYPDATNPAIEAELEFGLRAGVGVDVTLAETGVGTAKIDGKAELEFVQPSYALEGAQLRLNTVPSLIESKLGLDIQTPGFESVQAYVWVETDDISFDRFALNLPSVELPFVGELPGVDGLIDLEDLGSVGAIPQTRANIYQITAKDGLSKSAAVKGDVSATAKLSLPQSEQATGVSTVAGAEVVAQESQELLGVGVDLVDVLGLIPTPKTQALHKLLQKRENEETITIAGKELKFKYELTPLEVPISFGMGLVSKVTFTPEYQIAYSLGGSDEVIKPLSQDVIFDLAGYAETFVDLSARLVVSGTLNIDYGIGPVATAGFELGKLALSAQFEGEDIDLPEEIKGFGPILDGSVDGSIGALTKSFFSAEIELTEDLFVQPEPLTNLLPVLQFDGNSNPGGEIVFAPGEDTVRVALPIVPDHVAEVDAYASAQIIGTTLDGGGPVVVDETPAVIRVIDDEGAETWLSGAEFTQRFGAGGDPHLVSFDGLGFDIRDTGDFVLFQGDGLEAHIRITPLFDGDVASGITATAFQIGATRLELDLARPNTVTINGAELSLSAYDKRFFDGGWIAYDGSAYQIVTDQDDAITVLASAAFMTVSTHLSADRAGTVSGLLGDFDGNTSNDLSDATGQIIQDALSAETFYGDFVDAWRVPVAESLFSSPAPTARPDRELLPSLSLSDLPDEIISSATAAVGALGAFTNALREDAILDVALTGDLRFAEALFVAAAQDPDRSITQFDLATDAPLSPAFGLRSDAFRVQEGDGDTIEVGFSVYRLGDLDTAETFTYAVAGDATLATGEPLTGTVSFAAGQAVAQVKVSVTGDTVDNPDRSVRLDLDDNGSGRIAINRQATAIIRDDDDATDSVISAAFVRDVVYEEEGALRFVLERDGMLERVDEVRYELSFANGGSAADLDEETPLTGVVEFAAGDRLKLVDLQLAEDTLVEGAETVSVTLQRESWTETLTATILDEDMLPLTDPVADAADVLSGNDVTIDVLANDGVPASLGPVSVRLVDLPVQGQLEEISAGIFRYSAGSEAAGVDGFSYRLVDASGRESAETTATITIVAPDPAELPVLYGAPRQTTLRGSNEAEIIVSGETRSSQVYGRDGADVFVFGHHEDNGRRELLYLRDFDAAEDMIDLLDATISNTRTTSRDVRFTLDGDGDTLIIFGAQDPDEIFFTDLALAQIGDQLV